MTTTNDCHGGKAAPTPCGCATPAQLVRRPEPLDAPWTDGVVPTGLGPVPRVRTTLGMGDRWGAMKVRWAIGRMDYRVPPGLYAVGEATPESPVFVSANYKLSFDHLRRALAGRAGWILVLDTRGVNVWCAAGKGTFGTDELVRRVVTTGLGRVVSHRKLVVPQLGATGVSAHEVRKACGFTVVYGPVRAADLPAFLDARMKASPEMRRVRFDLRDRVTLVPVDVVTGARQALPVAAAFLLLGGLSASGYSRTSLVATGIPSAAILLAGFVTALALGAALLPWLPGRAFSLKGAVLGAALVGALTIAQWWGIAFVGSWLHAAAWALIVPALASYAVMNFTGSSTFTSLSGVVREMRVAVPLQIAGGSIGAVLWIAGLFVGGGVVR